MQDRTGNVPPLPGIYPDYMAPIVRNGAEGLRELVMARWGMPSSHPALFEATAKRAQKLDQKGTAYDLKEMLRMEPDSGTTNIRNVKSKHWQRWLGVVPFTSFSEFNRAQDGNVWFAFDASRPRAFFAGLQ
jgi:putative SOS response-associated peptidase YedK